MTELRQNGWQTKSPRAIMRARKRERGGAGVSKSLKFKPMFDYETFEEYADAFREFLEKHPEYKSAREAYFSLMVRLWRLIEETEERTVEKIDALAKECDEARQRVADARLEANRKEREEWAAAQKRDTEERLSAESARSEARLASDRRESEARHEREHRVLMAQIHEQKQEREARHQIELARIEEGRKEALARAEADRKEFASQKRWLIGIFLTGVGLIAAVVYTVVALTGEIARIGAGMAG